MKQYSLLLPLLLSLSGCATQSRDIAEKALQRVAATGIRGYSLDVSTRFPSTVIVEGTVSTEEDKRLALSAIKQVPGAGSIEDRIAVTGKMTAQRAPQDLKTLGREINAEVSPYPLLGDLQLEYRTDAQADLYITGHAPSQALVMRIKAVAERRAMPGQKVFVKIDIPNAPPDSELRRTILNRLNAEYAIDTELFRLKVTSAVVTITGQIRTVDEKNRITALVLMVDGVKDLVFEDR